MGTHILNAGVPDPRRRWRGSSSAGTESTSNPALQDDCDGGHANIDVAMPMMAAMQTMVAWMRMQMVALMRVAMVVVIVAIAVMMMGGGDAAESVTALLLASLIAKATTSYASSIPTRPRCFVRHASKAVALSAWRTARAATA